MNNLNDNQRSYWLAILKPMALLHKSRMHTQSWHSPLLRRKYPYLTFIIFVALFLALPAWGITIPATQDLSCVAARISAPNCTANDFEVITTFSAAPNTPPFCMEGESFEFEIDVNLTSKSPNRYDIGFFFGQNKNDPANDTANNCSVATFPTSYIPSAPPSLTQPWGNIDNNVCSDFFGGGSVVTRVNKIKVMCQGNSTGALLVPYTLVYSANAGTATSCTGPANVQPDNKAKCQGNISASVSGIVKVFSGAYVDVTKQTSPDGDSQAFSYTATGPPGSSVIALTNPTSWSPLTGGTYTPSSYSNATNSVTVSLNDGQTARFIISALDANQTLTITEEGTPGWNSTAAISCSAVTGEPPFSTDNGTRTISVGLSKTNLAAACTVTNEKLATVTIVKKSNGGTGSFSFSGGSNGLPASLTLDTGIANPKSSTSYTVTANNTATAISETTPAEWTLSASCTDGASSFGSLSGGTLTIPAVNVGPGKNIICTFTNTKKIATVTLQKTWVNAIVNDAVNFAATGLTSLSSIANPSNKTDAGTAQNVYVGSVLILGETFTAGSAATYASSLACTGTSGLSGNTLTVGLADTAIVCTFTNTLSLPNLTVLKTAFGVTSGTNAKAGQDIPYVITVTNTGTNKAWEVKVTDALSPYSSYKLNSLAFADGATSSGLSMVNSTISYSYDNGGTWTTTAPTDLGGGYNGTVTNWRIVFDPAVQMNANNAFFTISYRASVK